jgi:protein involved in polysaccharide export with SLBB domain
MTTAEIAGQATNSQTMVTVEGTGAQMSAVPGQSGQGFAMTQQQGGQQKESSALASPVSEAATASSSQNGATEASVENYGVVRVTYRDGMLLSQAVKSLANGLSPNADLESVYLIRAQDGSTLKVDMEKLLYSYNGKDDVALRANDRVVIPFMVQAVYVKGEVTKSSQVGITGMSRLSAVVMPLVTRYSSIRDVRVKSFKGEEKAYDLFKADRQGDLSQNPLLRPGDVVTVGRAERIVTLQGEVRRPGIYQMLPGEGIKELIEYYAQGFTEKANPSRMTLVRYLEAKDPAGETEQFDYTARQDMILNSFDVVSVPTRQDIMPVVWFEGAVGVGVAGASLETSQRIPYTFFPGEKISQAAIANRGLFSAVSDLSNAYIIRNGGTKRKVDLSRLIYNDDRVDDFVLEPNDVVIVPFRQFFVTVSGAVHNPGRYAYIPDRTWDYYVGLAGGFDTDRNTNQKITIYDANAKKMPQNGRFIQPEDNIEAAANSFLYGFNKVSGVMSTILTLIYVVLEIVVLVR